MKKAKIALTAVAVLAAIGGALAFKARGNFRFYSQSNGVCNQTITAKLTTAVFPGDVTFKTTLSVAPDDINPCPIITVKTAL